MYEKKNLSPPSPLNGRKKHYNSQMRETTLLKFGMWGAEGGGGLHYKNDSKGAWSYVCMKITS